MPTIIPRRPKSVDKLTDAQLRDRIASSTAVIEALPSPPPHDQVGALLAKGRAASASVRAARAELNRRAASEPAAPKKRRLGGKPSSSAGAVLDQVARFGDLELAGVVLDASKLSTAEADELKHLVESRSAAELTKTQADRWDELVGRTAGVDLPARRAELASEAKLEALAKASRRHPEAASLVAAIAADPAIFAGLVYRLRPDVVELDDFGNEHRGTIATRVYELEHVAVLFLIVNAIAANGGLPVEIGEHGIIEPELPTTPPGTLAPLALNGYLEIDRNGPASTVGLGERSRAIAKHWRIPLEEAVDARNA